MKVVVSAGPYFRKDEVGFYFNFGPTWHVWVAEAIDAIDSATGHRLCNNPVSKRIQNWMYAREVTHYVPATEAQVREFYAAAGWDCPLGEDD
jgi:hypothetical protein